MHAIIYLVPVNHFDPLGREDLIGRLRWLRGELKTAPVFVAVEYDPEPHQQLVQQRPRFREMLAREWPGLSPGELDTLAQSLAYDGDAHPSVFPEANTLWLDRGRRSLPDELEGYAEGRLRIYRAHAGGPLAGRIPHLSQRIQEIALQPGAGDERDGCFADTICAQLACTSPGVVIVGAHHANEAVPGTMATILRDRNVEVRRIQKPGRRRAG